MFGLPDRGGPFDEARQVDATPRMARQQLDVPAVRGGAVYRRCAVGGGDACHGRVATGRVKQHALYGGHGLGGLPVPDRHQPAGFPV